MGFNKDFIWGVATAAFQIDGAANEDGRGSSIWDEFCLQKDKIWDKENANIACDHYHLYKDDIKLMKDLGVNAYRFSISWPRILPDGVGEVNQKGIDFYNNLIDELIKNDIIPYVTLYHWDFPYDLFKRGGWLNPQSPEWFKQYTDIVAKNFGDRVKYFITFNEPQCFIGISYARTMHAPAIAFPNRDIFQMAHNVLKAHGLSVISLRENVPNCKIGFAPTGAFYSPMTDNPEDIEAARKATFDVLEDWSFGVSMWSDPIFLGKYPDKMFEMFKDDMPKIEEGDMELISQPLDFCGQNMYTSSPVKATNDGGYEIVNRPAGFAKTAHNWAVTPNTFYWIPKFLYERYKKPILITENGMSCHDTISLDGKCHDPNRIDYTHRYLLELKKAIDDNVDIIGYFHWSLMDNFEWTWGYQQRFGIVHIDFQTLKRTPKDSFYWYKDVIKNNGEKL